MVKKITILDLHYNDLSMFIKPLSSIITVNIQRARENSCHVYCRQETASQTVFSTTQYQYVCVTIIQIITEVLGMKVYSLDKQ